MGHAAVISGSGELQFCVILGDESVEPIEVAILHRDGVSRVQGDDTEYATKDEAFAAARIEAVRRYEKIHGPIPENRQYRVYGDTIGTWAVCKNMPEVMSACRAAAVQGLQVSVAIEETE